MNKSQIAAKEKLTNHCVFGPSQLSRIVKCPASVAESLPIPPRPQSVYAAEGSYLHKVMETAVDRGMKATLEAYPSLVEDEEKRGWVQAAHDFYRLVLGECSPGSEVIIEQTGSLASFGVPEVWGTADVVIIDRVDEVAHVIDWKFGKGVQVSVKENVQLLCYGGIALGYPSRITTVFLHVVQPPWNTAETVELTYQELADRIMQGVAGAVRKAQEPNPAYNPSYDTCRWCPAGMAHKCKAKYEDTLGKAADAFEAAVNKSQLTNAEWVKLYDQLVDLEKIKAEVYDYLTTEIELGREVPGKKLVSGRSIRKWKDAGEAIAYLESLGIDPDKLVKKTLVSPAQAEKLNRKLKDDEDFQQFIDKPEGKPTLVDESDPREAITFQSPFNKEN